jgi:hypothetical protein
VTLSITEAPTLAAHDQAAGILYCIARRLFNAAKLGDPAGWESGQRDACRHWAMIRNVGDHFMRWRTVRIGSVRIGGFCEALNFAHTIEHSGALPLLAVGECPCLTAKYIRELAAVRGEVLYLRRANEAEPMGAARP